MASDGCHPGMDEGGDVWSPAFRLAELPPCRLKPVLQTTAPGAKMRTVMFFRSRRSCSPCVTQEAALQPGGLGLCQPFCTPVVCRARARTRSGCPPRGTYFYSRAAEWTEVREAPHIAGPACTCRLDPRA